MSNDCMTYISIKGMIFYCHLHDCHQPDIHVAIGNNYGYEYVLTWKEKQEYGVQVFQEALEEALA